MAHSTLSSRSGSPWLRVPFGFSLQVSKLLAFPIFRRTLGCFVVFAVSALLILPNLGFPRGVVFDESYYIAHAQKYLNSVFFCRLIRRLANS